MKTGMYSKLALQGIKKNRKLYTPYIVTGITMVMMTYLLSYLSVSPTILNLRKGDNITQILGLGFFVLAVFSVVFMFYTNSFIMNKRDKEFGLYNIMGMSKSNISKIIVIENVYLYLISVLGGLFFGVVFSKLAELSIAKIMKEAPFYGFSFLIGPIVNTASVFAGIFVVLIINSLRKVNLTNPVNLLHSESTGEKKPKANWVLGIIGLAVLVAGYFIAVKVENPVDAITYFFFAVILVIIATYILFVVGSVLLCHILKNNKKYYYKANHFASVSSMMFRMKRNGAGLASICILATMVLVMMSSVASLFFGSEDAIRNRFPYDINIAVNYNSVEDMVNYNEDTYKDIKTVVNKTNFTVKKDECYKFTSITGLNEDGYVTLDVQKIDNSYLFSNIHTFNFVELDDYNRLENTNIQLNDDEVLVYSSSNYVFPDNKINFEDYVSFKVKDYVEKVAIPNNTLASSVTTNVCVVKSYDLIKSITTLADYTGNNMMSFNLYSGIDLECEEELKSDITGDIYNLLDKKTEDLGIYDLSADSFYANKTDYYGTFGGMFFLGIVLSLVFMFATVLIIYYKQLTEGYEDRSRFEIMQKVGMTDRDIKKSINSQMLTVFFAPIIMAVVHLSFAFPLINKILVLFGLTNLTVILITMAVTTLVFAVFYAVVYKITSNEYYRIVKE